MPILRDFEVLAGTSRMFENKLSGRATMASNIAEVQFVRCEAVIFEVLKACVYLAMAYLLVRACFFNCNLHSQGSPVVVLVPA